MTEQRLAEIQGREYRALSGPFEMFGSEMIRLLEKGPCDVSRPWERLGIIEGDPEPDGATVEFLCQARQDIPDLLNEVKRLRAENAELKRDAACFAALYEMADLGLTNDYVEGMIDARAMEWTIVVPEIDPNDPIKDIERFRKAIEAGIPA